MPTLVSIRPVGNNLLATYDNDSTQMIIPTAGGFWVPRGAFTGPGANDGEAGEDGSSADDDTDPKPTAPPPDDPDPVEAPSNGVDLYNPWKNVPVSGTWENHMSYSLGGIDLPLAYNTPLKAPANGTLHINGGSGEYAAGVVGSAGRRAILYLDKKFPRKKARGIREGEGPMVAVVLQHLAKFGRAKHYNKGDIIGYSGASAVVGGVLDDYGSDVHLQVHGLNRSGSRVNFFNYF